MSLIAVLHRVAAPLIRGHAIRANHNWFFFYDGPRRPWNVRLWCGDADLRWGRPR